MKPTEFERKSALENPSAKLQELANNLAQITNYTPVSTIREHLTVAFNAVNSFIALNEGDECPEFHTVIEQIEAAKLVAARIGCNSIYAIVLAEHDAWEIFSDVVCVELVDEPISPIGTIVPKKETVEPNKDVWQLTHGRRVKLSVDLPDDNLPLFAGDLGTVESFRGERGIRFDRYEDAGITTFNRALSDGRRVNVVDYCLLVDGAK